LLGGGQSLTSVTLANVEVQSIEFANDTLVLVRADSGTPGQGDVILTANTGAFIEEPNAFTFGVAGVINTIVPASGQFGTRVVISGTQLQGSGGTEVRRVTLAGIEATIIEQNSTSIIVQAAVSNASVGNVILESDTGATLTVVNGWTYRTPGVISVVSPASGQVGTRVVISGTDLAGGGGDIISVTLGGVEATVFNATNSSIVVIAQFSAPQIGDVIITSDSGAQVIAEAAFQYLDPPNGIIVNPDEGQTGTLISLCGSDLLGGGSTFEAVLVGQTPAIIINQNETCVLFEVQEEV
jgi:hypothetical protein